MQPDTPVIQPLEQPVETKKLPRQRHFLAVFFISFMWGIFGIDRMYLGKWLTGILKLVTIGGFGLWAILDLSSIMAGSMRDGRGREMLEHAEYKSFASKTVFIFTAVLAIVVIGSGAIIFAILAPYLNDFLQSTYLTPELMTNYGL